MADSVYHLVTGGCGFVGRNLVKRLLVTTDAILVVVDDLSIGKHPSTWLDDAGEPNQHVGDIENLGPGGRLYFYKGDVREFFRRISTEEGFLKQRCGVSTGKFTDVYHFAAIVGGRAMIDGNPMAVALDLAIDAEFFYWVTQHKPARVLYPSSSAAYPIDLQAEGGAIALKESSIKFDGQLGQPDMTYGWSKLTGEYLAQIAAKHYGIRVACVRPFSGYGEDQDLSYPIPAIAARAAKREDPFEVWGTGHQGRDFVHIDDCIDCILLAMDTIQDGSAVNIGSGRLTSFREIIALMAGFAGYNPTIKPLTDKPVGVYSRYADPAHSIQVLGFTPKISLAEGMARVYAASVKRLNQKV